MDFVPAAFVEIADEVREYLTTLPAAIDSFLERHILESAHYRIVVAGEAAGFASIHRESLITQFALAEPYRQHGQALYRQLRRMEQVQAAFVPTCDEFYLSHALDDFRHLAKQAYFFAAREDTPAVADGYALRPAEPADAAFARSEAGEFLEDADERIVAGELFLTMRGEEAVGFGLAIASAIYPDVASIGMFTIERFRREGVGTATIGLLIAECRRRGRWPVAGCWYYNHRSKQTLERAGMYSPTRLLKIEY